MINLFACDLDGTLLNLMHNTDDTIRKALREITATGARFAVATGRTMHDARDIDCAGIPMDLIGSNGSIVRSGTGELLKTFPIDPAALEALLTELPNICFECVTAEGTYVTGTREEREEGFKSDHPVRRIIMRGMRGRNGFPVDTMYFSQGLSEIMKHEVCKINCRVADEGLKRALVDYLDAHKKEVVDAPFAPRMFEITGADVNKGTAVAWLAEHYGISEDEVAVYGDGGNDIAMLKRFAHSYAPHGASEPAKRAASAVIGRCALHAVSKHMVATVRAERGHTKIA